MNAATEILFFPTFVVHGAAYLLLRRRLSWLRSRHRLPPATWSGAVDGWNLLAFIFSDTYGEVGDQWVTRAIWTLRLTLPCLLILIVAQAFGN